MKPYNYAYLTGKIRALETRVLDDTDIERMADASDFDSAFKVLNDTDYANNLLDVEPRKFRDALRLDFSEVFSFLRRSIPDRDLFRILYLDRDFLNLRYLFKKKYSGAGGQSNDAERDLKSNLVSDTVYPYAWLELMVAHGKNRGLDEDMAGVITLAQKEFQESESMQKVDGFLSIKYYELLGALSKKLGNDLIKKWIKIRVDNANLAAFLRAKIFGLAPDLFKAIILPGGHISKKDLMGIFGEDKSGLKAFLVRHYDAEAQKDFDDFLESNSISGFERGLENFVTRFLGSSKRIAYGPEVVVAYFVSKSVAVKNVRVIMTGKDNLISGERIKSMIRATS